jgi:hypothetical protein
MLPVGIEATLLISMLLGRDSTGTAPFAICESIRPAVGMLAQADVIEVFMYEHELYGKLPGG